MKQGSGLYKKVLSDAQSKQWREMSSLEVAINKGLSNSHSHPTEKIQTNIFASDLLA